MQFFQLTLTIKDVNLHKYYMHFLFNLMTYKHLINKKKFVHSTIMHEEAISITVQNMLVLTK